MSRGFARISIVQASKDGLGTEELAHLELPTRATMTSAGYDLKSLIEVVIEPGKTVKVPTGLRAFMLDDEVLLVHIRSSLGFKYNVRLANATGELIVITTTQITKVTFG
jgi:dUTP pyrophosphatase